MTPRGALPYGESGPWVVWETMAYGQYMWRFDDEDLAMQWAVHVGSQVEKNTYDSF